MYVVQTNTYCTLWCFFLGYIAYYWLLVYIWTQSVTLRSSLFREKKCLKLLRRDLFSVMIVFLSFSIKTFRVWSKKKTLISIAGINLKRSCAAIGIFFFHYRTLLCQICLVDTYYHNTLLLYDVFLYVFISVLSLMLLT